MKSTNTIYKHVGTADLISDMGTPQASLDFYEFKNGRAKLCDFPSFGLKAVPYSDPDATHSISQKNGQDFYFAVDSDVCHIYSPDDYLSYMHYPENAPNGMISYESMRQAGYSGVVVHYDPQTMKDDPLLKGWKGDAIMIWDKSAIVPVSKEIADLARTAEAPDPSIDESKLIQWAENHMEEIQAAIDDNVLGYYDMRYVLRSIEDIEHKLHEAVSPVYEEHVVGDYEMGRDVNGEAIGDYAPQLLF